MRRTDRSEPSLTGTQQAINSVAATAVGVYLITHSIVVTVTGLAASTLLTAWRLWLTHRRALSSPNSERSS
jgi:hypothetical protein